MRNGTGIQEYYQNELADPKQTRESEINSFVRTGAPRVYHARRAYTLCMAHISVYGCI